MEIGNYVLQKLEGKYVIYKVHISLFKTQLKYKQVFKLVNLFKVYQIPHYLITDQQHYGTKLDNRISEDSINATTKWQNTNQISLILALL